MRRRKLSLKFVKKSILIVTDELPLIWNDPKNQFQERRLLGGDEFIQSFQNKLIVDIEVKYKRFTEVNEEKEKGTKVSHEFYLTFSIKSSESNVNYQLI